MLSSTGTRLIDAVDQDKRKGSLVSVLFSVHSQFFFFFVATYVICDTVCVNPPTTLPFNLVVLDIAEMKRSFTQALRANYCKILVYMKLYATLPSEVVWQV